jgi:hypothetical protein
VNRRGRGLGRRAGSQRRLRRLPNTPREGFATGDRRWRGPNTPSGHLARGITCPPPGVNRDPPAQAPARTFRPGGRPEEPRRSGANQSDAKIIPSRAQQPRPVGISRSGVAARAQRAHTGPEQQTCARALEGHRGHGDLPGWVGHFKSGCRSWQIGLQAVAGATGLQAEAHGWDMGLQAEAHWFDAMSSVPRRPVRKVAEPDPHHPAASAEPPTPSRGLRAAARPCASSALRRVVATAEDGLSATAGHPRLWGRRRRRQREPGNLRGDAAGYIRRPRRARPGATKDPLGNRGVGDLTTNMTHTTPLARMASSRILLAQPWAEGLEVALDGLVL